MGALPNAARTAGFTLVEVLVSILIISFGLLGVASLQTRSLALNTDAYYRTQAQNLVMDLAERMRANWRTTARREYVQDLANIQGEDCDPSVAGKGRDGARAEYACWLDSVARTFGTAAAFTPRIATNAQNAGYVDLTLGWPDRSLRDAEECGARATGANGQTVRQWDKDQSTCFTLVTWSVQM